jgi:hypothetical protein
MKSKQFLKEGFVEDAQEAQMDHEVQMARVDCYYAAEHAMVLHKLLRNISEEQGLEGWVASKITLANDYLKSVREHLEYQMMSADADESDFLPIAEGLNPVRKNKINESDDNRDMNDFERGPWYIILKGSPVSENGSPKKFNWLNGAKTFFRTIMDEDPKMAEKIKQEYEAASDKKSIIYYSKKLPTTSSQEETPTMEASNKPGLWANIRAKRERIKSGSGERMRSPGSKGAPSDKDLKSIRASSVKEGWQDEFADMVGQMKKSGRLGMPKSNYNFKTPEPKSKEELMSRLKELAAEFDPAYQQSDDYSFWSKQNKIQSEISSIRRQLRQQGVAEGSMPMPKLPRRHFFDTWGEKGNGIAYTDNTHWWKIINGKIVDFTNSYEGTKEWKREFVARQKQGVAEGLAQGNYNVGLEDIGKPVTVDGESGYVLLSIGYSSGNGKLTAHILQPGTGSKGIYDLETIGKGQQGVAEGEVIRPDFSRGKGVENPNITAPKGYDRFEVDGKKIIGIKNGKKTIISTTSDERLTRELVMIYNGGKASTDLKPISMLQAFGSKQLAAAENMGIKLAEKPDYWEDFEEYGFAAENNFNEIKLKKLEKAIGKLKTYRGVDIYGKTAFGDKPRGPQVRTIFMPPEDMFIVKFDDGTRYVVDKTGAMTYIRNWQKINDITDIKEQGVAEGNNSSPFNQEQNLRSKNNNELADLIQFWNRALEKNPDHKVAREQLGLIKMIRAERIGKKGVAEAKSPQEFMTQISKSDSSILNNKKESPYYAAGKMLSKYADKIGQDSMDFADFKQHAALLMGGPEANMKSAKQVRNLDTAASDIVLDMIWEYSSTQKDADTYFKISGFKRLREGTQSTTADVAEGSEDEGSWDQGWDDGYNGYSYRNPFPKDSVEYKDYLEGFRDGRLKFEKKGNDSDFYVPRPVKKQGVAEGIKGWKHAHSDMMKHRAESGKDVHLVSLKKDGTESKMHDAKKSFKSEEEARAHHKRVKELNPNRTIAHNLYVGGKVEKLS